MINQKGSPRFGEAGIATFLIIGVVAVLLVIGVIFFALTSIGKQKVDQSMKQEAAAPSASQLVDIEKDMPVVANETAGDDYMREKYGLNDEQLDILSKVRD